jgi:hypothetical protein
MDLTTYTVDLTITQDLYLDTLAPTFGTTTAGYVPESIWIHSRVITTDTNGNSVEDDVWI